MAWLPLLALFVGLSGSPEADSFQPAPDLYPAIFVLPGSPIYHLVRGPNSEVVRVGAKIFYRDPNWGVGADPEYEIVLSDPNFNQETVDFAKDPTLVNPSLRSVSFKTTFRDLVHQALDQINQEENISSTIELPRLVSSGWMEKSMRIRLSAKTVEQMLNDLSNRVKMPEEQSSTSKSSLEKLVQNFVLAPILKLDSLELDQFRKSSVSPLPKALHIPLDIPFQLSLFNMKRIIQLDELEFNIHRRKVGFKPSLDSFELRIEANSAEVKGPMHDLGYFDEGLGLDPIWRWDRYPLMLSGTVGGLSLQFQVGLNLNHYTDGNAKNFELWTWGDRLADSFLILFTPEEDGKSYFRMNYLSDLKGGDPQSLKVEISEGFRPMIQAPLLRALSDGLGAKIPRDQLSFALAEKWRNSEFRSRIRINQIDLRPDGIELLFDTKFEVLDADPCIQKFFTAKSFEGDYSFVSDSKMFPSYDNEESKDLEWGFELTEDSNSWAMYRSDLNSSKVSSEMFDSEVSEVEMNPEVLNAISYFAWGAGMFCRSSSDWWDRPEYLPAVTITPTQAPQIGSLNSQTQSLEVSSEANISFQGADEGGYKQLSRLGVQLELGLSDQALDFVVNQLEFDSGDQSLLPAELSALNEFARYPIEKLGLTTIDEPKRSSLIHNFLESFGVRDPMIWMSEESIGFSFSPDSQFLVAQLFDDSQDRQDDELSSSIPMDESKFRTLISGCPHEVLREPFLKLGWNQRESGGEGPLYQYRVRKEPNEFEGKETDWSIPSKENHYSLVFNESGVYEFQVRALDLNSGETESEWTFNSGLPSYSSCRIHFLKNEQSPNEVTEGQWKSPSPDRQLSAKNIETNADVERMNAKGPFGCSFELQSEENSPLKRYGALILMILLLISFMRPSNET